METPLDEEVAVVLTLKPAVDSTVFKNGMYVESRDHVGAWPVVNPLPTNDAPMCHRLSIPYSGKFA